MDERGVAILECESIRSDVGARRHALTVAMTICGDVVGWIFRVSVYLGLSFGVGCCTLQLIIWSTPLSLRVISGDDGEIMSYCVAIFGRCNVEPFGLYVIAVLLTLVMATLSVLLTAATGILWAQTCLHITDLFKSKRE